MAGSNMGERMPGYFEMLNDVYSSYKRYIELKGTNFIDYPGGFLRDVWNYGEVSNNAVFLVILFACIWTVLRYFASIFIFRPFAEYMQMTPLNASKFPESAWKAIYCTGTWTTTVYLLIFSGKYDYFENPQALWSDWKPRMEVPWDICLVYAVQFSFYLHSVYATLYMDHWRKDSIVMLFHHILTMLLIGFSYAARYHKIGMLVLLVHDVTDICLEFTKCNVYMKSRAGKSYAIHEHLSNVGFIFFASTWYVFRLYWYPLKVIHSASYGVQKYGPESIVPFYAFFNIMLWILQGLNVYWFMYIVNFLIKIATGQMSEVDDVREDEVMEKITSTPKDKGNHKNSILYIVQLCYKIVTGQIAEVDDLREEEIEAERAAEKAALAAEKAALTAGKSSKGTEKMNGNSGIQNGFQNKNHTLGLNGDATVCNGVRHKMRPKAD